MPKPINKDIGTCTCPICGSEAKVRRQKNHPRGAMYISCGTCGTIPMRNQEFFSSTRANFQGLPNMQEFYPEKQEQPKEQSPTPKNNRENSIEDSDFFI